jgi:hypothetical protein
VDGTGWGFFLSINTQLLGKRGIYSSSTFLLEGGVYHNSLYYQSGIADNSYPNKAFSPADI